MRYQQLSEANSMYTLRPEQNEHFAKIWKCIFLENFCILIDISLKFFCNGQIANKSTLVQVVAWHHQATSHYLNLYWPKCLAPYGIAGPQWVEIIDLTNIQFKQKISDVNLKYIQFNTHGLHNHHCECLCINDDNIKCKNNNSGKLVI